MVSQHLSGAVVAVARFVHEKTPPKMLLFILGIAWCCGPTLQKVAASSLVKIGAGVFRGAVSELFRFDDELYQIPVSGNCIWKFGLLNFLFEFFFFNKCIEKSNDLAAFIGW